jgi:AAA15 family ATPase/GTPase
MLTALQEKMQRKAKGFFEDLLTELVTEVLPTESGKIILDLSVKNNKTSLDVLIEKDGKQESVFIDNGGALTNVISMGLRFIVLSRSANRRFLVFDEADAWIKPDNIPLFVKVVEELSVKLGIQVVIISHHDIEKFKGEARIIKLERNSTANIISSIEAPGSEKTNNGAFKSIRLRGYKSHTNTLLELHPFVTVIYGDNNIGKSHISRAFNSIRNSDTVENNINHKAKFCRVEIVLEDNNTLYWEYHRSSKRRTKYKVVSKEGVDIEYSDEGGKAPVWINDFLFMDPINGLDVHIVDQKYPVYLIGDNISSFQRAEMLSLGSDNENVKFMIKHHNELIKEHQSNIRSAKKRLNYIERDLKVIRNLEVADSFIKKASTLSVELSANEESLQQISIVNKRLKKLKQRTGALLPVVGIESDLMSPDLVNINLVNEIKQCLSKIVHSKKSITSIELLEDRKVKPVVDLFDVVALRVSSVALLKLEANIDAISKIKDLTDVPSVTELNDVTSIRETSLTIAALEKKLVVFKALPKKASNTPELINIGPINDQRNAISKANRNIDTTKQKMEDSKVELSNVKKEESIFLDNIGHKCPICKQGINHIEKDSQP